MFAGGVHTGFWVYSVFSLVYLVSCIYFVNYALKEAQPEVDAVWIPLQPGQITVGDQVRVMSDAFDDKTGMIHNGRLGKVMAIRYGDVIFKSTDGKSPELNGVHYSPYKLEKRVK
jgi:hypothetical protein